MPGNDASGNDDASGSDVNGYDDASERDITIQMHARDMAQAHDAPRTPTSSLPRPAMATFPSSSTQPSSTRSEVSEILRDPFCSLPLTSDTVFGGPQYRSCILRSPRGAAIVSAD